MRIGELLVIKIDNIDIGNKYLEINGTNNWVTNTETGAFTVIETTKTIMSYRTIRLTTKSINLLKTLMLENKKENSWNAKFIGRSYIFANIADRPIDLNNVNNIIKEGTDY